MFRFYVRSLGFINLFEYYHCYEKFIKCAVCSLRRMRRLDFILLQLFIIHLSRSHQRLSDRAAAAAAAAAYLLFGSNK